MPEKSPSAHAPREPDDDVIGPRPHLKPDTTHEDASGHPREGPGVLYVVATPIGHLGDLSRRAIDVLNAVRTVAAEDTRVSRPLLERIGSGARLMAAHQHNEQRAAQAIVERLRAGEDVALISDAGTPAISDPGVAIVAAAHAAGARVVPVPGPSAVTALLSAAGLDAEGFVFAGFLPTRPKGRDDRLRALLAAADAIGAVVVVFEAPHRIADTLAALPALCGADRPIAIGRELTKQFEEVHRCAAADAPAWLAARAERTRGEFVIALAARRADPRARSLDESTGLPGAPTVRLLLARLLQELPTTAAVRIAHDLSGAPREALYALAVALKGGG